MRVLLGLLLCENYGFEGDVRESGAISAGGLLPQAARIVLLAGVCAGADRGALRAALGD